MSIQTKLAEHAIDNHPDRSVTVLERLEADAAVQLLRRGSTSSAVAVVQRLSPQHTNHVLCGLPPQRSADILDAMPIDAAARMLRRIEATAQNKILDLLEAKKARAIRSMLAFKEGTAGALMDPNALALPQGLSAREALQRVRKQAELARYNIYVVDQEDRLIGAFNLCELLNASGRTLLSNLMTRDPFRIVASTDRASILNNPGWKRVHSLPVVDADDCFLGIMRYRTLREVENELLSARRGDADTGTALGEVIAAAAGGVLDALGGSSGTHEGE